MDYGDAAAGENIVETKNFMAVSNRAVEMRCEKNSDARD